MDNFGYPSLSSAGNHTTIFTPRTFALLQHHQGSCPHLAFKLMKGRGEQRRECDRRGNPRNEKIMKHKTFNQNA